MKRAAPVCRDEIPPSSSCPACYRKRSSSPLDDDRARRCIAPGPDVTAYEGSEDGGHQDPLGDLTSFVVEKPGTEELVERPQAGVQASRFSFGQADKNGQEPPRRWTTYRERRLGGGDAAVLGGGEANDYGFVVGTRGVGAGRFLSRVSCP